MKVFITGASGFIGQSVVREFLDHGYEVTGLVRSQEAADVLAKTGAKPHIGSLTDMESLKSGAAASDGAVHLAFIHDFDQPDSFQKACAADRAAIQAMGDALAGTGKPLIICSGTLATPKGMLSDEDTPAERSTSPFTERALSSELLEKLSSETNIRGMTVRLCPIVHGKGDKGFVKMIMDGAKKMGTAVYIDDGSARWPSVHRNDAASLFRLAFEKGRAGATYNAVAEQGIAMKDIMSAVAKGLQLPVESKDHGDAEALAPLGFIGFVIGMDNPTSSEKTRKEFGWVPQEDGLLKDLEENYFD